MKLKHKVSIYPWFAETMSTFILGSWVVSSQAKELTYWLASSLWFYFEKQLFLYFQKPLYSLLFHSLLKGFTGPGEPSFLTLRWTEVTEKCVVRRKIPFIPFKLTSRVSEELNKSGLKWTEWILIYPANQDRDTVLSSCAKFLKQPVNPVKTRVLKTPGS